ncbi:MAG: hypothetical protein HYX27_19150 [Acidobacteria bacterium]|nr:hypothetical protein [Acidobacteriota bacterium]
MKKKTIIAAVVLLCAAAASLIGARGNVVIHYNKDGTTDVLFTSAGSCRHHLTAHPNDSVAVTTGSGQSGDPADCN